MSTSPPKCPDPFLEVRVHRLDIAPGLTGLCAGYELGEWRCDQLAAHLMKWLPEFALSPTECETIGAHNAVDMVGQAARAVYASGNYQARGEFGELLLHVVLRQVFNTYPAISKYYFKDSANDTVKGFDAVHVVATDVGLELWIGEVKFYTDIATAIRDVVEELEGHTQRDYLRSEFTAILHKVDDRWAHAERLRALLDVNTSLDKVFDAVCLPVLLTYDSPTIASFSTVSNEFKRAFEDEVMAHYKRFCSKSLPDRVRIHLFLLPLSSKGELVRRLDERLKACQAIV